MLSIDEENGAVHNGMPTENTVVQAFDGTTEYFINCEYTRAQAAEIRQGCAQILNTLALERASEHEATRA